MSAINRKPLRSTAVGKNQAIREDAPESVHDVVLARSSLQRSAVSRIVQIPLDAPFVAVWQQPRHLVLRVQVEQDQRGIYYGAPLATLLSQYPLQEFREGAYSPRIRLATPGLVGAAVGVVRSDGMGYYVRSQPCSPHWRRVCAFTPEEEDEEAMDADEGRYAWNGCTGSRGSRGGPGDLGILVEIVHRPVTLSKKGKVS
ncbi:hypothetical protein EDB85DRAFT_2195334 [Lactarius pseudohatsudake]|nr:hypothetical protein EDB85DRAFT_2195334 [Lactarius pseudohatsudake]